MEDKTKKAVREKRERRGFAGAASAAVKFLARGVAAVADSFAQLCVAEGEKEAGKLKKILLGILFFFGIFVF